MLAKLASTSSSPGALRIQSFVAQAEDATHAWQRLRDETLDSELMLEVTYRLQGVSFARLLSLPSASGAPPSTSAAAAAAAAAKPAAPAQTDITRQLVTDGYMLLDESTALKRALRDTRLAGTYAEYEKAQLAAREAHVSKPLTGTRFRCQYSTVD